MSRDCSVCSTSKEIQKDVLEHHSRKVSHKKIAETIKEKFKNDLSVSAIGRHLKNCINTKEEQKKIDTTKIDASNIHETLRRMLFDGVQKLLVRMQESVNEKTNYDFHLETYKCMNLFIDMLDKLSPKNEPSPREQKRASVEQVTETLTHVEKQLLYMFLTKKMTLRSIREFIDEKIAEKEESEKRQNAETNLNPTFSEEG